MKGLVSEILLYPTSFNFPLLNHLFVLSIRYELPVRSWSSVDLRYRKVFFEIGTSPNPRLTVSEIPTNETSKASPRRFNDLVSSTSPEKHPDTYLWLFCKNAGVNWGVRSTPRLFKDAIELTERE